MVTNRHKLTIETQLDMQGRIVIPASVRKALSLHPGDKLIVRPEGETVVLERRETILAAP